MITYRKISEKEGIEEICAKIKEMKLFEKYGDFQNWVMFPYRLTFVFAAFDGEQLVGYTLSRLYSSDWQYNAGAYVTPEYRRMGIGTRLMSMLVESQDKLVVDINQSDCKKDFFFHVEKINNKPFYSKF